MLTTSYNIKKSHPYQIIITNLNRNGRQGITEAVKITWVNLFSKILTFAQELKFYVTCFPGMADLVHFQQNGCPMPTTDSSSAVLS